MSLTPHTKFSAALITGAIAVSGLIVPQVAQAQDSGDTQCTGADINAALVLDNTSSMSGESRKKAIESYNSFLDTAKKIDPKAKVTLFNLVPGLRDKRYYTKVFDLSKPEDEKKAHEIVTTLATPLGGISGLDVEGGTWTDKEVLPPRYQFLEKDNPDYKFDLRHESDLFVAMKRVYTVNDDRKFNLVVSATDTGVLYKDESGSETLKSIGADFRSKGSTVKTLIIDENKEEQKKAEDPKHFLSSMSADSPKLNKDYFVGDFSKMSQSLAESLNAYCVEKNPDFKPKPKPTSEKPKPTSEKPTSEKPTSEKPTSEKPTSEKPTSEKPTSEKPTSEKPTSEKPTSEKPTSEEPTTEPTSEPTSEEPTTEPSVSPVTSTVSVSNTATETMTETSDTTNTETSTATETENSTETSRVENTSTTTVKPADKTAVETAVETQVVDKPYPVVQPAQQVPTPVYGPKVHTGGGVKVSFLDKVKSFILG